MFTVFKIGFMAAIAYGVWRILDQTDGSDYSPLQPYN